MHEAGGDTGERDSADGPPAGVEAAGLEPSRAHSQRRLRIALIGARGVGGTYSGIETYYEELGSRLVARGHSVTAYCRNHFTPDVPAYRGIEVRRLPCLRTKHLETASHSLLAILDSMFRRYDVVQIHAIGSAPLAVLLRLAGKTTVVSVRGLDWQRSKWGRVARWALRFGEWASIRLPNATVVVSETLRDRYQSVYGRRPRVIQNPVPPVVRRELGSLAERGLNPRGFFLYAGRISPEKHVDTLVEAARPLAGRMPLVVAGSGSYSDDYVREVRDRAGGAVIFLGQVDRECMQALLSNAFAFVLPSALEGLSVGLLEALAYGNCIAVSEIPENREVVADAGVYFPPGEAAPLRAVLEELVERPERAEELRERARQRAGLLPDWDRVAELTESLYSDLMNEKHPQ